MLRLINVCFALLGTLARITPYWPEGLKHGGQHVQANMLCNKTTDILLPFHHMNILSIVLIFVCLNKFLLKTLRIEHENKSKTSINLK